MIPSIGKLAVLMSKYDVNQKIKNLWKQDRFKAMEYYRGITNSYTSKYFSDSTLSKVVTGNINITRRIIDRISLVYMTPPARTYTREDITDYFIGKELKMQRLERMTNLLDAVLLKPCWRVKEDGTGCIEYDIITDYEPIFEDDPLTPTAIVYPIAKKSTVLDDTPELWAYWDSENHFTFDSNGKTYTNDDNPDMLNPYGRLPFVECFREGRPEYAYLDTEPANDIIKTNTVLNVAETNKSANIHFQSFGYIYANGSQVDKKDLEIGQDQIYYLGVDGTLNVTSPPNSVPALTDSIKESYKMLAQNYHLPTSFADGTTAESGVALRMRNQELSDDKKSSIIKWNDIEKRIFEVEKQILTTELMIDTGELESVDFGETADILSAQEQREQWEWELSKGIIDVADILVKMDPDRFVDRDEALLYLEDRGKNNDGKKEQPEEEKEETNPLLSALTKPV